MRYYTGILMALATAVSAVVCFAVSLEVGERRDEVTALKRQIASDMREVRRLQAEWQIRVRPAQLQRLNDTYFGLTAPTADRYFASADAYVAFAADPNSVPQKAQVMPAIEQQDNQYEMPQTYLAKATGGEAHLVAVSSDGPAVAMRLPSASAIAAAQRPRPGFGPDAPKVHLASWSGPAESGRVQLASWSPEPAVAAQPKPKVASKPVAAKTEPREDNVELAMRAPAVPAAAAPYAPAIPKGATPLSGLDASTIASIERLAAIEAGTQ
ncbi:cell division protein FtsL [Pedomonas mirosovicensis]|uniref:cell division protein FtsL n=1 Tax=Pedomonas mirosovicensis TaxID=2908641 RepID=UPI00216A09B4|nr:hypothetical protein [Pedomonas mirosovicensis]MCH8684663.1 hypothetical protein [Pedomonas mirosovicensis]